MTGWLQIDCKIGILVLEMDQPPTSSCRSGAVFFRWPGAGSNRRPSDFQSGYLLSHLAPQSVTGALALNAVVKC